jgi:ABC-type branched-subunit amino acid transport system ATPase component
MKKRLMLDVDNLHVRYGNIEALHGISFRVQEGETVEFPGASGAGKPTALMSIMRLPPPEGPIVTQGRITYNGTDLLPVPPRMSGGEQQMPTMERAFMSGVRFILLDEPSMGLTPFLMQELFGVLKSLNESGTTIPVVGQNASIALGYTLTVRISWRTGASSWKVRRRN